MAKDDGQRARQSAFARSMRLAMSDPERRLWIAMRRQMALVGTHFRRQVRIGPFIVDFCCFGHRLVVEVNGGQHFTDAAERYDSRRDRFIESQGFRVLRFSALAVRTELDSVIDTIIAAVTSSPTPYPSPQGGGERQAPRLTIEPEPAGPNPPPCGEGRTVGAGWGRFAVTDCVPDNQPETMEDR